MVRFHEFTLFTLKIIEDNELEAMYIECICHGIHQLIPDPNGCI